MTQAADSQKLSRYGSKGITGALSWIRHGFRVLSRVVIKVAWIGLVVHALAAAVLAYRHDVSFRQAVQDLLRDELQALIAALVYLHDPCPVRAAPLGPGAEPDPASDGTVRIEDLLARPPCTSNRQVTVLQLHNERIVRSRFRFAYQPYDEPRLHELRTRYRLDQVIAPAADEFEAQVRLRNWCRSQFRRKDYQPLMEDFDALAILDRGHRNDADEPFDPRRHMDPCYFFPRLYCQVLLSMGHQARLVAKDDWPGHGMVEVWSNQYRKWVLMDAELNHYFEKDGVPLNLLEVHNEIFEPGPTRVKIIRGEQTSGDPTTLVHLGLWELRPEQTIPSYHHIQLTDLRNDWLTNRYFPGHPARGECSGLFYQDPRSPPWKGLNRLLRPSTTSPADLYWTLNQAEVWARWQEQGQTLGLSFRTVTPNFAYFEVSIDGDAPLRVEGSRYEWRLHEGDNSLSVRAVNRFGVAGPPSLVRLSVGGPAPAGGS